LKRLPTQNGRSDQRNLLRFHGDAATSAVEDAAINYQSPSIIAAGANAQSVSILTTIINLSLSLICVKAPALIEKLGLTKKGGVTLSFINLIAWVPLVVAFLLSDLGITPAWFAVLWLVNVMPGVLLSFQRDNWLSNLIPGNVLGRYLGQRMAIKSAFYLGAFCLLGYMMDRSGDKNLSSFAYVFVLALVMSFADYFIFTFMREPENKVKIAPEQEVQKSRFGLFDYVGELKKKKLDTFISFTSLFYITVGLTGPLYAVYMLQEQHFTYLSYTVIFAAEFLARVVSAPFWGRFADKAGNIRVLGIVSRIIPALPICWLFCSNVGYLVFVQVLSGICWGAFDLSTQSYLYKVAPPEKKLRYIVYTRCLMLFSTAVGGLVGAYLVNSVFFTFGSKLLSVFMISGFFRAIVVMYLMPKLVDLAVSYGKPAPPPEASLEALGKAIASKRGLFYQVREQAVPVSQVPEIEAEAALEKVVYMRRRNWAIPASEIKETQGDRIDIKSQTTRCALYHTRYMAPVRIAANTKALPLKLETDLVKPSSRPALYYDRTGWMEYLKDSIQALTRETRVNKAAPKFAPVFVENGTGIPENSRMHISTPAKYLRREPAYIT
jgi:hypothetical protein